MKPSTKAIAQNTKSFTSRYQMKGSTAAVYICATCRASKPADGFHADKKRPSGLCAACKECAIAKSRAWYLANKDRASIRNKTTYAANREKYKAKQAAYYKANHAKALAYMAKRRRNNAETVNAHINRWRENNWARVLANVRNYKARKRRADGRHSGDDIKRMFIEQSGLCAACRLVLTKFHVDHVMPLILGGSNDRSNLQLLCPTCNASKGGKHPATWRPKTITGAEHGR